VTEPSFVAPPVAAPGRPVRSLVRDALSRPGGRRGTSVLAVLLLLTGLALFAYPNGTDVYGKQTQQRLKGEFEDPAVRDAYRTHTTPVGAGLTRLRIPKLGVDVMVVQGTTTDALRAGAGHYMDTPLPGEVGNVGIAGHRTTFGRPFNRLDELRPGDTATLETPFALYTYTAVAPFGGHANPWVVAPTTYTVIGQQPGVHWLTLTTCHPKGSAQKRLVERFQLTGTHQTAAPA
jgi:sortase A